MKLTKAKLEEVKRRLLARVVRGKTAATAKKRCWSWKGTVAGKGYPISMINGKRVSVRRALYLIFGRNPPLGDQSLRATCGNVYCVNPYHMKPTDLPKGGRKPREE